MAQVCSNPAEIPDNPGGTANAGCGAGASTASPAVSKMAAAGMTRRRRNTDPVIVLFADMVTGLPREPVMHRTILLLRVTTDYA